MTDALPQVVVPLPEAQRQLLARAMAKMSHDIVNNLVGSVSMLDLVLLQGVDPALSSRMQRIRQQMMAPRDTLQVPLSMVPERLDARFDGPALRRELIAYAEEVGVQLSLPADLAPPSAWQPAYWLIVVQQLVLNALQAHANDPEPSNERWCHVLVSKQESVPLEVRDNGPGHADWAKVAQGNARRSGGGHLGVGLPICANFAEKYGYSLMIGSTTARGCVVLARRLP